MTDEEAEVIRDLRLAVYKAVGEHARVDTPFTAVLAGLVEGLAAVTVDHQLQDKTMGYAEIWDALKDVFVSNADEIERRARALNERGADRPN